MLIRPIQKKDGGGEFTCGVAALDSYLSKQAWTHDSRGIARVYVLTDESTPAVIHGYYSLASRDLERERLRETLPGSAYPNRNLPVFYIGYFAVAKDQQGQGLGRQLLGDALGRCVEAQKLVGAVGIYLDSYDEASTRFYAVLGFEPIPGPAGVDAPYPQPMFLAMNTLLAVGPAGA
ncbi:MAG TPA: GNAT family N-acetyltransferase [Longimicrobium sp.]|nr:GNAT family N-acetyltransferase [Longimicrobium sp.]